MDAKDIKTGLQVKIVDGNSVYAGRIGEVKTSAAGKVSVALDTEDGKFQAVTGVFAPEDLSDNMDDEVTGSTAEEFKGAKEK